MPIYILRLINSGAILGYYDTEQYANLAREEFSRMGIPWDNMEVETEWLALARDNVHPNGTRLLTVDEIQ